MTTEYPVYVGQALRGRSTGQLAVVESMAAYSIRLRYLATEQFPVVSDVVLTRQHLHSLFEPAARDAKFEGERVAQLLGLLAEASAVLPDLVTRLREALDVGAEPSPPAAASTEQFRAIEAALDYAGITCWQAPTVVERIRLLREQRDQARDGTFERAVTFARAVNLQVKRVGSCPCWDQHLLTCQLPNGPSVCQGPGTPPPPNCRIRALGGRLVLQVET